MLAFAGDFFLDLAGPFLRFKVSPAFGAEPVACEDGRIPDQLRQALEWETPEDPFSGKDFVYRRDDKGYLLYSLGSDLDDDGGKPPKYLSGSGTFDGDRAWRVAR